MSSPSRLRRASALLVALGFYAMSSGCVHDTAEKFLISGKSYLEQHNYSAAVIQFKNALSKDSDNAEARYLMSVCLLELGDAVAAEVELRKAASLRFSPKLVYPELVRALLEQGKYDKAIAEAAAQQSDNPGTVELLALSGEAYLGLNRVQDARTAFTSALAAEPLNQTAALGIAKVSAAERDLPHANAKVDEVLQKHPESYDALMLKGELLQFVGNSREAVVMYSKATHSRPYKTGSYLRLVPLLVRTRDLTEARVQINAFKKISPRSPAASYLDALVTYVEGDVAKARELIQQALKGTTDYVPAVLLAGTIAHDLGNNIQAVEYLGKVIGLAPNDPYPRRLLISTFLRSGQTTRAADALRQLLQIAPNDIATFTVAGEVALASGDVKQATQYYQKALALSPNSAMIRTRLGQARGMAGETQRAVEDLEAASAADPNQYQADVALVLLRMNKGDWNKAREAANVLAKKQPNNPLTHNLAGMIHVSMKEDAKARASFERALALQPTYFPAASNLAGMDLRDGNAQAAKQRYEALLAKDPKQESAVLALADVLQKSGSAVSEIEKVLDRGIASNPGATRLRTAKVQAAINRGDGKAAITAAQEAQAAFPEQPDVVAALGRAQLLGGEFSQAVATFSKLAQLMPTSAVPLLALADAAGAARDWSAARQAIQKAIQLQPDSMPARRGLVEVELQAGRADEAHAAALAIQKQWPNGAAGYLAEAHVLINQKKESQAEQVLRTAMRKTGNSALALRLFTMLQAQGRTKDAATLAADWLARNPNDFLVADYVGDANLRTKDYAAAAQWYTEALKIRPNNATLLNNLAWAFGQLRDAKALEYGRKALSLEPTNPAILDTVGWLYVEAGDLNQGLELLGKATALAPNAAPIKLNYARALVKAGQNTVARPQLESLTKLPPGNAARQEAEKILSTL